MKRSAKLAATAAVAIGGLGLAALAAPASASDSGTDHGTVAYPGAAPWDATSVVESATGHVGDFEILNTGVLPNGKVVPMQRFRVGPLFGKVGGPHTGGVHGGLDMGTAKGTPIVAVAGGKVVRAGWQGAAGKAVTIRTADGKFVLYGHMSKVQVKQGQRVTAGQRIGLVGSTGNSTGPHLHLQVNKPDGSTMDPLRWLDISAGDLRKLGRD